MMARLATTPNEKAAAVTSCDGLDFVLRTTTASSHGKNDDDGYIRRNYA